MQEYTDDKLREILQQDFIDSKDAFTNGNRNNSTVDSMCICFALDIDWKENVWDPWCDKHNASYWTKTLEDEHSDRVGKWLDSKEAQGYKRGEQDILRFCIDY